MAYVDAGRGWLIFRTGPSELGVHPTSNAQAAEGASTEQHHQISLMCDDIHETVAALTAKGAQFTRNVSDDGFGLTTMLTVPGAGEMMLYQPRHPPAHDI